MKILLILLLIPSIIYGGVYFDGTDDYINVPNSASLQFDNPMSIMAWIKIPSGRYGGIVTKCSEPSGSNTGYLFRTTPDRKIEYQNFGAPIGFAGNTVLDINTWYHVAMTWSGSTITLYVNGAFDGNKSVAGASSATTNPLNIGRDYSAYNSPEWFIGKIADARIDRKSVV